MPALTEMRRGRRLEPCLFVLALAGCAGKPTGSATPQAEDAAMDGENRADGGAQDELTRLEGELAGYEMQLTQLEANTGDCGGGELPTAQGGDSAGYTEDGGAGRCKTICQVSESICGLESAICGLSAEHLGEARYEASCTRAQGDCADATTACAGCTP